MYALQYAEADVDAARVDGVGEVVAAVEEEVTCEIGMPCTRGVVWHGMRLGGVG